MKVLSLAVILLVSAGAGCRTDARKADQFIARRPSFPVSVGKAVLLYLPNRLLDIADLFHFGYGIGPGFGLEFQATRTLSAGAVTGTDFGVAWLGRHTSPVQAASYGRANLSEWSVKNYPTPEEISRSPLQEERDQPAQPDYDKRRLISVSSEAVVAAPSAEKAQNSGAAESRVWRFPRWDVGIHYHALLDRIYLGFAPDELLDLLVGFTTFDLKKDDF